MPYKYFIVPLVCLTLFYTTAQSQSSTGTKAPAKKATAIPLKEAVAAGEAIYTQYCISCHQADGGGLGNMNPPLLKTSYVSGDKKVLISVLLNGMSQQEI